MTISQFQVPEQLPNRKVGQGESFLKFKQASDVETFPQDFADYVSSKGEILLAN